MIFVGQERSNQLLPNLFESKLRVISRHLNSISENKNKSNHSEDEAELLVKEEDASIMFDVILGADIKKIYEELNKEYVGQGLLDEQTFDMYVRRNITLFQLGEKI